MDLDSPFTSGSAITRRGPPTRKCSGVNAKRSVGSSDMGDSGLEFSKLRFSLGQLFKGVFPRSGGLVKQGLEARDTIWGAPGEMNYQLSC